VHASSSAGKPETGNAGNVNSSQCGSTCQVYKPVAKASDPTAENDFSAWRRVGIPWFRLARSQQVPVFTAGVYSMRAHILTLAESEG
jgi:hypothetical protein